MYVGCPNYGIPKFWSMPTSMHMHIRSHKGLNVQSFDSKNFDKAIQVFYINVLQLSVIVNESLNMQYITFL